MLCRCRDLVLRECGCPVHGPFVPRGTDRIFHPWLVHKTTFDRDFVLQADGYSQFYQPWPGPREATKIIPIGGQYDRAS